MSELIDSKVEIFFPLKINGFDEPAELPFVIGVLGDFTGNPLTPPPLRSRKFIEIDSDNFDDVLQAFSPRLLYSVENKLQTDGSSFEAEFNFKCLADFDADRIARQFEPLRRLTEDRENHPDIKALDAAFSGQLESIMHHPAFKSLEAAWRGLYYLVSNIENNTGVKVKIIQAAKIELLKDFLRPYRNSGLPQNEILKELDRKDKISAASLYKWIYDNEFNVFAGEPFGVLLGNYEFSHNYLDVDLLSFISKVAALAHTPFIAGASPAMFSYNNFFEMYYTRRPVRIFSALGYKGWHEFREIDEARYVSLCLPHFLLREKYGEAVLEAKTASEVEDKLARHLWGNAAFAFGVILARAFARNKWLAQIDGDEFGALENMPAVRVGFDTFSTNAYVFEHHFQDLSNESLNVITKSMDKYFFLAANSCLKFKPIPEYDVSSQPIDTDLRISSSLPVTFAVSRFVQYLIKIIKHESARQNRPAAELQEILNNWINGYCANSPEECSAQRPLSEARVEVKEINSPPARHLVANIYIKPGYQLPETKSLNKIVFDDF